MIEIIYLTFLMMLSYVVTCQIRKYTLVKKLVDVPNSRSSHTVITPRGGGIAIVLLFLVTLLIFWLSSLLVTSNFIAIVGASSLVAVIGFIDDHGHIPAKWRLLIHLIACAWFLGFVDTAPVVHLPGLQLDINIAGIAVLLVIFALVWLLNLFNFMDGIDGIAASEAVFVSALGGIFVWIDGQSDLAMICFALASASVGFLLINWPPAKIFMGDVGSGFLGITLGMLAYTAVSETLSIWVWLILLAVFLVDATFTLIRRILLGQRWYSAHCNHAYQRAARRWGHLRVTLSVIFINLFWLMPLAWMAYLYPEWGILALVVAIVPLTVLAVWLKAGLPPESQSAS